MNQKVKLILRKVFIRLLEDLVQTAIEWGVERKDIAEILRSAAHIAELGP